MKNRFLILILLTSSIFFLFPHSILQSNPDHPCYEFFGNGYLVITNSCCGFIYHNQTQTNEGETNILVKEIHHMGTGKRQPNDATKSLFLFMNKEETDMWIIMLGSVQEAKDLMREIAIRQDK